MGAAAIAISSTVVIGLLLWWSVGHWSNWRTWCLGVMFGNGIAGTTLGGISLVTGKSVVELTGAVVRSANRMAGGKPAVTVGPVLALVVISGFAAHRSETSGRIVAVLAVMVGTATVGTMIGNIAAQANTAVVDTVREGVNSVDQQVNGGGGGGGAPKGYGEAPAPAPGPSVGMNIGNGG